MAETQGDNRATNPGGVYVHRETGEEIIAIENSKFGSPQADAFVRAGFQYKGPAPKSATEGILDPHAAPLTTPQGVKSVDELKVELAAAEAREKEMARQRKEREDEAELADMLGKEQSKTNTQSVADNKTTTAEQEVAKKKGNN